MVFDWWKPRRYRHLDRPVNETFAKKVTDSTWVENHNFLPLLHYKKTEKRYKKDPTSNQRFISTKTRSIRYASHRDSCVLSFYAHKLNIALESFYKEQDISKNIIAYRSLGMSNYHFSAEAFRFAREKGPVAILAFDVTGFFDNLDHTFLKKRISQLMSFEKMPLDWYRVFRSITNYHDVDLEEFRSHPKFSSRFSTITGDRIASVEELKAAGIKFRRNPEVAAGRLRGIPQGTPISAAASNAYMIDFDRAASNLCDRKGALYRRYSDDILVICRLHDAATVETEILRLIQDEKLDIATEKTERTHFDPTLATPPTGKSAQYLGFTFNVSGPAIRESSLSRQWRKMRRAINRAKKSNAWRKNKEPKIYTKKLYRKFTCVSTTKFGKSKMLRNFSSYGRKSASAFGADQKISRQLRRFERAALNEIKLLNNSSANHP